MVCLAPDLNEQQDWDNGANMQKQNGMLDENLNAIPSAYPIIDRADLDIGRQLGFGSYGSVYSAQWKSRSMTVAVKKVFMLEKEAYILSRVRHRNIIQFYGVCPTNPDFFIVTEFAELGSLYDYLHNQNHPNLAFSATLNWAMQIAQGVHYLHYEAPDIIIHRDLKSKNVVLSKDNVCKLCDFGTSKNLTHSQTAPTWGGTAAWMSPEIVAQNEGITTATDVWSYAVVLWELLSREVPYDGLSEFRIYTMIAEDKVKLVIPESCPHPLATLMGDCWKVDPKERLDFRKILADLNAMRDDSKLNKECEIFLKRKDSWKQAINEQMAQLKARERELARKSAELDRREQALEKREHSQRSLNRTFSSDATMWDEVQVCAWVEHLHLGLDPDALELFFQAIRRHSIDGNRLMDLSRKDLEFLGLASLGHSTHLFREIQLLRQENHRLRNFPSLAHTQQMLQRIAIMKTAQPLTFGIVLHVTMYQRQADLSFESGYRFKVLVDSDWQEKYLIDDLPPELRDPHAVIQNVCITTLMKDQREPHGNTSKRCQEPFGLTHWVDAPTDGSPVTAMCVVSYTDRVLKPRNTRLTVDIVDFTRPHTLLEKAVQLTVRPFARKPSSAAAFSPEKVVGAPTDSPPLRGVWLDRSTIAPVGNNSRVDEDPFLRSHHSVAGLSTKSPLWAEIAAGLRESSSTSNFVETPRQRSSPVTNSMASTPDLPVRAVSSDDAALLRVRSHASGRFGTPSGRVQRRRPAINQTKRKGGVPHAASKPVQNHLISIHSTDRPSIEDSLQPSVIDHRSSSNEESTLVRPKFFIEESQSEPALEQRSPPGILTASKAYPNGFFARRTTTPPETVPSMATAPIAAASTTTTTASGGVQDDSKAIAIKNQCSRKVHGGYEKWAWKG